MKKIGGTKVARRDTLLQSALKNGSGPRNELQTAWDSLGKAKSLLHQVDHKMMDLSKPSSADILWHLPDFLYCLVDQESLKDLPHREGPTYPLSNNVHDSHVKRKVSYKESRADSESQFDSISDRKHSNTVVPTDGISLPISDENTFAGNIPDISSISALSSNVQPQSSAWNASSLADITSSTALRDTDIRYLNDVAVQPKSSVPQEPAKPPRFHHVDVVIPAGYSKKSTGGLGRKVTIQDLPDGVKHIEAFQEAERDVDTTLSQFAREAALSRQLNLDNGTLDGAVIVRKVAAGPPAPTHRGFHEPQSRIRSSPVKARWVDEQLSLRVAEDRDGPATQAKNTDMISEYLFPSTPESAKKRGRVTGTGNSDVAKKEIITTNSWRAGSKLTRDLGLTFTSASKSKADAPKESKKTEKTKDRGFLEDASLSDVAKEMLRDLQPEKESAEEKKKTSKKKLFRRKPPMPPLDETPQEKPTKVVLYDANEARKFIRKQKEQRRRDRMLTKESEMKTKLERQQRLEELGKRQHEAAVKSMRKNSSSIMNRTWDNGMMSNNDQLSEADDDSSEECSNESDVVDNDEKKGPERNYEINPQQQSERPRAFDQNQLQELKNYTVGPTSDDDDDLTAQEIVNRFAVKSGLTLEDIVTNYAKYADEIMRSFIAKDDFRNRSKVKGQKEEEGSAGRPKPSSVSSRLEAILRSSKSLQSRLNTETERFATDPVMSSGANVRPTHKTPRDYINNFEEIGGSASVVFGSDLPGSNHRPVTESLALTESRPGVFSSGFVYHVQQSDLTVEQQEAIFKKELRIDNSKKESCPFYLRPPLGQLTNKMDGPLLVAAKLVPSWNPSATEADPLSILNIFNRRQKGMRMMNENDGKISKKPSKQKMDSSGDTEVLEIITDKEPLTPSYLSAPSTNYKEVMDEDGLSLIPERDSSVRDRRKNHVEPSIPGKRNLPAVNSMERIQIEMEDDNSDSLSSVPPVFSQRSDPWQITPKSEVMTNRSDGVSYTMDFTDAVNMTDDEDRRSDDHLGDRSGDHSVDRSVDHSDGWSGRKGGSDQFDVKERTEDDEARALATTSDISSLTDSDQQKEDDSNFSNVTSVTLDSALLNQQSKVPSQIQDALPLFGDALANPVLAPVALEARMSAELNLLENMDEVLHQVNSMERTRAIALAQQETVALAQVLKARQQSQSQEVEAARVKLEKENVEESRRLQSRLAEVTDREHSAAVTRIQATADAISSLQDAMHRLTQTQADAAQLTADAAKRLAEASAIALEKQQDRPEMGKLLTESATAAASAAVIVVMQQLQSQKQTVSGKERRTSISSESPRRSSKQSHRRGSGARSDRSEKSGSYRTGASSMQTSEYDSGSDATNANAKRSRKSSSINTEQGFVVGTDLSRPGSVQSVAADSDILTASDMSKVSRKSRATVVTDIVSERTKSVVTASDVSSEENTVETSSITTELSVRRARSRSGSRASRATEQVQSEKDYASDYDSVTEDELEKSLREIVPSESQREKLKKNELKLNLSSGSDRTSTNGRAKQSPGNNSFDRFNIAMVQQYLKEEAVRHQHKQMLLQLREKALKEKTTAELAWLEQQKQALRKKGLDDKYPELSKKQNTIRRRHKKYQEELNRLKAANQMTLEAQKLLLSETRGVDKLQKSVQQVKQRMKNAGVEGTLPDLDVTTDDDVSISLVPKDETDAPGRGDDFKSHQKESNETLKKLDKKRLIEREESLQRKVTRFEKLLQNSPKQHRKDLKSRHNKKVSLSPRPLDSARSVGTASDALTSARTETGRTNRLGSVSEDLAAERSFSARNARSSAASITEEVSTARSVNTVRSGSQDSSADIKEDMSEVGNKSGSSDESVMSLAEQLSRRTSITSERQRKSPRARKISVSENKRKQSSNKDASDSDDDFTLSQSVDVSDRSELEGRIENLTKELKRRKKEAEQLKKRQEKKRLKLEEEKLRQKLKDYDSFIKEAKMDLQSPTSAAEEQKGQTKSISHHTSTSSSDSSVDHSTILQDLSSNKLKTSELQPSSGSKRPSGQRKGDDGHSQANTRRSSMSEDVVDEDLSVASLSAGGEKVLLDLDLGVSDDLGAGQQPVTPRSARSEARIPESARTLADIPEDYSVHDDLKDRLEQSASQAEPSEKAPSKSIQSQASDLATSYTEDFSDNSATSLEDGPEKQSTEKSAKLSLGDRKTGSDAKLSRSEGKLGSDKVAAEENESTDEDISEELLPSVMDSEDEEMVEMKIVKDDPPLSDANMELEGSANSPKDNDASAAENIISDKEAKKVKYEEVTKTTLDMLLKETIDEIIRIRKQKQNANSAITREETVFSRQQMPQKTTSYPAANEKEDILDDKYSFDDDWDIPTKLDDDVAATYEQLPVAVEPVTTLVPHNKEEVLAMVNRAVDLLWNSQNPRHKSLDSLKDEVASRNRSEDVTAAQSKASYSRLVFDLTAEALCTIYMDESTVEKLPWCLPKAAKGTRHYVKPLGVTAEHVKPTVQERVLRWLGLDDQNSRHQRPVKKFRRRRGCQATKSDQLDELVLEDLHEEESGWVDYSQDELNIKMDLADSIFESMIRETVSLATTLKSRKQN